MFTLYLETVLKEVRNKIRAHFLRRRRGFFKQKTINLTEVEKILKKWNLHLNNDKTEVLTIERNNDEWKSCKKLGMYSTREKNGKGEKPFRLQRWQS